MVETMLFGLKEGEWAGCNALFFYTSTDLKGITMSLQSVLQYRKLKREFLRLQDPETGNKTPVSKETLPPVEPEAEDFIIVNFRDDNDENNPRNWSTAQRVFITSLVLTAGVTGGWASANDSVVIPQMKQALGVSAIVESLSTGLYLIAFGIGSLFTGPFSDTIGRNPVYLISLVLLMVCIAVSGAATNIAVQLAFRFLAGLFGCVSITTGGGTTADLWAPNERGLVFAVWSCINFCSVFAAPVVSSYIGQSSHITWRWSEWVVLLMGGVSALVIFLFALETHAPTILSWKAKILRNQTKDIRYRSEQELKLEPLSRRLLQSTWRSFDMLFHELSVLLFTLYLAVLFVVAFTFLPGYSFIYGNIYHLSQGEVGLCFLGLDVGMLVCLAITLPLLVRYGQNLQKAKDTGVSSMPPEDRLWIAIITAPGLPIGLFWMAWTIDPSISFWCSLVGSTLVGSAFLGAMTASYLYLIDAFESRAASALSVAAFVRYALAGTMIPVSILMYENLGVHWTLTLLACISLVLAPVPFVMWKYGPVIRRKS